MGKMLMRTWKHQLSALLILTLVSLPAHAEPPQTVADLQNQLNEEFNKNRENFIKQNSDRKDGSGAAMAMGIVGAALAGLSCLQLLKQAAQEPDPAKKEELKSKALQQCAQAAQNAASAAQNGKQKDMLTFNDTPKTAQIKSDPKPTAEQVYQEPEEEEPTPVAETPIETPEIVDPEKAADPKPSVFDKMDLAPPTAVAQATTSKLNPIGDQLGFNDAAEGTATGVAPANSQSGMGGSVFGGAATPANPAASDVSVTVKRTKKDSDESSSGGSGEDHRPGNEFDSSAGSDSGSILSKLMGGGKDGGDDLVSGSGGQIAQLNAGNKGRNPAGTKMPNIFEYSSYRVRQVRREGGLKGGPFSLPAAPRAKKVVLK